MTDHPHGAHPHRSATGKERVTALDGLRAVALLIIMGYHFGVGWLQGGYFSLDIFYVLSGYLITGLLVSEYRRRSAIKLSAFWLRRARRLLPALLIVLVAVTLMVRFAEPVGLYPDFRMSALSALFYFSNWWQIIGSGNYFVATGAVSPLTHTWSLSVEEQFYLIWPLVVLAVMGLAKSFARGIRMLLVLSVAGALASALEMALLYSPTANTTRLYFGTDTHAQSILVGAAMACAMTMVQMKRGVEGMAPSARSVLARRSLVLVGLAGFAGTVSLSYVPNGTSPFVYRGGFLLSALSAAAIIIGAVCVPAGPVSWMLSLRPLVWLGTISYGAYLWHYPVFVYLDAARTGRSGLSLLAIRFAATFLLAAASYYLVERPVLYGTFWRSLNAAVPAAVLMGAAVGVVVVGTTAEASVLLPFGRSLGGANQPKGSVPVLVTGDSTALTLGLALSSWAVESNDGLRVIDRATEGCGVAEGRYFVNDGNVVDPVPTACNLSSPEAEQWPSILRHEIAEFRPRVVVLLAGRWEVYDHIDARGTTTNITQSSYAHYVQQEIQHMVTVAAGSRCHVVLLTAPYFDSGEQPDGEPQAQDEPIRVQDYNRLVALVAKANPRSATLVNLNAMVSPNGRFTATIGNLVVRAPDGVHFPFFDTFRPTVPSPETQAQVTDFARWIGPQIDSVIAKEASIDGLA